MLARHSSVCGTGRTTTSEEYLAGDFGILTEEGESLLLLTMTMLSNNLWHCLIVANALPSSVQVFMWCHRKQYLQHKPCWSAVTMHMPLLALVMLGCVWKLTSNWCHMWKRWRSNITRKQACRSSKLASMLLACRFPLSTGKSVMLGTFCAW